MRLCIQGAKSNRWLRSLVEASRTQSNRRLSFIEVLVLSSVEASDLTNELSNLGVKLLSTLLTFTSPAPFKRSNTFNQNFLRPNRNFL